jgi:hypothetical protein
MAIGLPGASHAVAIQGSVSCGDWIGKRTPNGNVLGSYWTWVLGYLSGKAVESKLDVLRYQDSLSISIWMDGYCQANPLGNVAEGSDNLFMELSKRKD